MRWLLITNEGNPGDDWARMGTVELVVAADPSAQIRFHRREIDGWANPPTDDSFDRAVVCGMPLAWASPYHNHTLDPGWQHYRRWAPRMVLAGFGIYQTFSPDGKGVTAMPDPIRREAANLIRSCRGVFSRSKHVQDILGTPAQWLGCPSMIAPHKPMIGLGRIKICSMMPDGAHYGCLDAQRAASWRALAEPVSELLIKQGFWFAAHSQAEREFAWRLGFDPHRVLFFPGDPGRLLGCYAQADVYVGNRVHGALVTCGFGRPALCVGYDSRLLEVDAAGGYGRLPDQFSVRQLEEFLAHPTHGTTPDVGTFRDAATKIFIAAME
jgi:hypothetical protein